MAAERWGSRGGGVLQGSSAFDLDRFEGGRGRESDRPRCRKTKHTQRRQTQSDRVPLFIQPPLQILNSRNPLLCVGYHFAEEIGEGSATQFGSAGTVDIPVVDGLAIRGNPKATTL